MPIPIPIPIPSPFWQSPSDPSHPHPHVPAFTNLHFPVANMQANPGVVPFAAMQSADAHRGMGMVAPRGLQRLASEQLPFNLRPRLTQGLSGAQAEPPSSSRQQQQQQLYPPPLADHQDVVAERQLFFHTLAKFHAFFGTQLVIPKVDGNDLDLHLMYCEVTASGGLQQVIKLKKWNRISLKFGLPTRVSCQPYFLRKHYSNLLHHYEQVYFFRREGLLVTLPVPLPSPSPVSPSHFHNQTAFSVGENMKPAKRRKTSDPADVLGADVGKLVGQPVTGAIDGKLEHGYLVTVHVGTQNLRGILFHQPNVNSTQQFTASPELTKDTEVLPSPSSLRVGLPLRKKRGKVSKRDPNAPRLNRSGYNFYFAEQRSRLKHLGSENAEITRIIGDSWQRLTDQERMPYLQRGLTDKERYKKEKKEYTERMKMQPQQRQGDGFYKSFPESVPDTGHEEAEQDSGDFNGSGHDYHVSLDPDLDGGEMNLSQDHNFQNQMYGDYVSADHLCHGEEQLCLTNKHDEQPIGHGSVQTVPLQEGKHFAEDHMDDLQEHAQFISEKVVSSQDGGQYALENAYRTQEGQHIEEQTDQAEEAQQYPDHEQKQFLLAGHLNHIETENSESHLSNNHALGGEQSVSTQETNIKEKQYDPSKQTSQTEEPGDNLPLYSQGTFD